MDILIEWFKAHGGWTVWLFIVAIPPQIYRNFRMKKYTSGSIWTWILFATAYLLFGLYMLLVEEYTAAAGQGTGFTLSLIILIQSLIYEPPQGE